MNKGGIARRLVRLARFFVGKIPGYLAATNVLTNMFFGDRDYSANYGLITTIYYCGMAAGIQLSSYSFDYFKSYGPVWLLYAAFTAAMLMLWLKAEKKAVMERKMLLDEDVALN